MWSRAAARSAPVGRLRDVTDGRPDAATDAVCGDSRCVTDLSRARRSLTVVELALLCGRSVEQIEAEVEMPHSSGWC
jgi:hypothetical protein